MLRKSKLSVRQMADLYEKGLSANKVANRAGISSRAVLQHLHRFGTQVRPRGGKIAANDNTPKRKYQKGKQRISIDSMAQHYREGKSLREISALSGVSTWYIRQKLVAKGVNMRPRGGAFVSERILHLAVPPKQRATVLKIVDSLGGRQV